MNWANKRWKEKYRRMRYLTRFGLKYSQRSYLEGVWIYDTAAAEAYEKGNKTFGRKWAQAAQACRIEMNWLYEANHKVPE